MYTVRSWNKWTVIERRPKSVPDKTDCSTFEGRMFVHDAQIVTKHISNEIKIFFY